jgi:hypothetical protein
MTFALTYAVVVVIRLFMMLCVVLCCSRGEPMTEEEANKMVVYAANENGRIYYVGGHLQDTTGFMHNLHLLNVMC